jgi:hypothetical protein
MSDNDLGAFLGDGADEGVDTEQGPVTGLESIPDPDPEPKPELKPKAVKQKRSKIVRFFLGAGKVNPRFSCRSRKDGHIIRRELKNGIITLDVSNEDDADMAAYLRRTVELRAKEVKLFTDDEKMSLGERIDRFLDMDQPALVQMLDNPKDRANMAGASKGMLLVKLLDLKG